MKDRHLKQEELLDIIDTQIWQLVEPETYGAVNQAHATFFGMSKISLQGRKINEIMPLDTIEVLSDHNSKIFKTGMPTFTTKRVRNHKGEERYIAITKTPKLNSHKGVDYLVFTKPSRLAGRYSSAML